ncbi:MULTISPECIES: alpha/beta fold hydrolase [unclassified Mycolicibacterium]|uniref:alpha/beta fold hydrolase n=1 Tax=unclassified Mycolicibacterium TaxID=2636767 RepID=UPI002ED9B24D
MLHMGMIGLDSEGPQSWRDSGTALILSGAVDHTLPSVHSRRMAQQLSDAHHIEVSGAGHLVPLEAPDEANRLIFDFLRGLPAT